MRLPRLKSTAQVVSAGGRMLILLEGDEPDLELEGDPDAVGRLLDALDGTRPPAGIATAVGASEGEVDDAISALARAGVVEDAAFDELLSAAELERYDRQLRYFADAGPQPRAIAQRRLAGAAVAVLGLGGLGGAAAQALAACGVGRIVGVDHDTVDRSNLARQTMFTEADVGRPKVEVARARLLALRSDLAFDARRRRLQSAHDVAAAVAGCDAVVAAVDWPAVEIGRWVDEACFAAGVPYVSMSQHPPLARVGPTYVPGTTGCHACQEARYAEVHPGYHALLGAAASDSPAATYAPASGVIGALVANEVVAVLTGIHVPACLGRSATLDLRTLETRFEDVSRRAGCPRCGLVPGERPQTCK